MDLDQAELSAAVEESLRKRLDDWMASTSEFYARQSGDSDRWRSGLVGYLMRGPGALEHILTEVSNGRPG